MDLAIGMVIGNAFTAIVTSLVNDIVMPLISLITGGISFTVWNVALGSGKEPPVLGFGTFLASSDQFPADRNGDLCCRKGTQQDA